MLPLQLDIVVQQPYLLAGLEGGETDIRTSITPESVAQCAVPTAANLALDCEVHLGQVVRSQLQRVQCLVGVGSLCGVFGLDLFFETACAVFAGTASLSGFGTAFGCWIVS